MLTVYYLKLKDQSQVGPILMIFKISLSWLKREFKRLGLRKRGAYPPDETTKILIQVLCTQTLLFFIALSAYPLIAYADDLEVIG